MTLLAIRILPEPVRTIAFGAIGAGYMGIGTAIDNPARLFFLQNLTDQLLMFSWDGVTDHFPLPSEGFLLMDVTSNKSISQGFFVGEGTRFYVRDTGIAPTVGAVYLAVFYGFEG